MTKETLSTVGVGALVALLGAVAVYQLLEVKRASSLVSEGVDLGQVVVPSSGVELPNFVGRALDGGRLGLKDISEGPCSVIVFFSPKCPWCEVLAEDLGPHDSVGDFPARWVSLPVADIGDVRDFAAVHQLPEPVLVMDDWLDVGAVGVLATPTLYLVKESGEFVREVVASQAPTRADCA